MSEPSFTLVQLRYFEAAARHLSMTAASNELMVSQSAVSTAIAQLEKEMGVQFLLRHHARGLSLTTAGEAFYKRVLDFLAHGAELVETARQSGTALIGTLTVGCFATLAPFRLPALLAEFEAQHPQVHVSLREGEHHALKSALRAGETELALLYSYDLDDDIDREVVGTVPPYALVAENHRFARRTGRTVSLHELADEPMVLLDLPHSREYLQSILRDAGVQPHVRHRTTGYETVRSLVAHGHGFALLNQRPPAETTYAGPRAVALTLTDDVPPLEIVVASMRGARLTRRAQEFRTLCRTRYTADGVQHGHFS
ncbi:LysR substrate-binding domain-containing protein [Saccharopolyspora mangrovi]|uniref:LysR substrate-binding domain-containing protein n=1 Tax=Saccharopolyspora mangrovi TaxID=3082379 RepID=A0ABU6AHD4_9PSEU|nr:LysR substrate-binding domain-containing protein [Saccharopolyspora sp. S2-29]MEB3370911.1 LysR substrate-binding domain-containing protein [Saccharopolyspora sp. S2-29]